MTDQRIIETANAVFTDRTTNYGAYTTTGAGIISALSKLDLVAQIFLCIGVISLIFTIMSFFMNWHYRHQKNKREQEFHQLKMQMMKEGKWHGQN